MVIGRAVVAAAALAAVGIAAHTAINLTHLRRPRVPTSHPDSTRHERISILIPARDEASTIAAAVTSACGQAASLGLAADDADDPLEILVLDDGSTDGTGSIVAGLAEADQRIRLISGADAAPPAGWLGKPWACARLAEESTGSILLFMDADVVLDPGAAAALAAELRAGGFAMVAPYPRQLAEGPLPRLIQPLVTWSWAATMPLGWAERSTRPSLSAANGQLLAMDAHAYRSVGGHGSVAGNVLEDVGLMRAFKRAGFRTATVDGSHLAACRMYASADELVSGYSKSLWAAFNGPAGSIGVNALLVLAYVVPAVAAVGARRSSTRLLGVAGYGAGVASRAMVAQRTGERILPDSLAQPVSILAFSALNAVSWWRHLRGTNSWKGRTVA